MSSVNAPVAAPIARRSEERPTTTIEWIKPLSVCAKIQRPHLERLAVVYVRQSTNHQVLEHRESTARQYALADYAAMLGWSRERILVVDEDQGQSGRSADARNGFQRLLMEVTLDHVGIVLGLEMSRLARSNKDWHHLLELCAIFGVLLADQEGIYDPCDPNDRLVLGLKGTMSELEIHTMRNRLEKGKLNKAARGELFFGAPIGYLKRESGEVIRDPDEQVRATVMLVFDKFDELGSLAALFRYLVRNGIRLGVRPHKGPNRGQLEWRRPALSTLGMMLHNPIYAGTYAFGRRVMDRKSTYSGRRGKGAKFVPMDQWKVTLHDRLPAYITLERYLQNQERLRQNRSHVNSMGAPRKGPALLAGIIYCGLCGARLAVSYSRSGSSTPGPRLARYDCHRFRNRGIERTCSGVTAAVIDALVVQQVHRALEPAALELSLRAAQDVARERERLSLHWKQQLERAHYDSAKAERHYRAVDPENRLVAATLEQDWERALLNERQIRDEYDRFLQKVPLELTSEEKDRIRALSADIPSLWASPETTVADRKEIIRSLLERVVVSVQDNTEYVDVTLNWAGSFVSQYQILRPLREYAKLRDFDGLLARLRELRNAGESAEQIAATLNEEGFRTVAGHSSFDKKLVRQLLPRLGLRLNTTDIVVPHADEHQLTDLAHRLQIHPSKFRRWIHRGWVSARRPLAAWSYIIWADREELDRLARLRDYVEAHPYPPYPEHLTAPKVPPVGKPLQRCKQRKRPSK